MRPPRMTTRRLMAIVAAVAFMRLPPLTVRRLMAIVAAVAFLLGVAVELSRLARLSAGYRRMAADIALQAEIHKGFVEIGESQKNPNKFFKEYRDSEVSREDEGAKKRIRDAEIRASRGSGEAAAAERRAEYWTSLARKYERAAWYPWLPVAPDPPEPK